LYDEVVVEMLPLARQRGICCALPVEVDAEWAERTAGMLRALADPTRLTMVKALAAADAPVCICDFTAALDLGQPTISHHMGKLRRAGLVTARKQGLWTYYQLRRDMPPRSRQLVDALVAAR
jgi:ArsR family transcriptional regulator, arsenate/arsenite/antimonite-responsive transcriptional repressor